MKVKVSDSLDNVPNENVVTHLGTNQQSNQLLGLLEWLFATKNKKIVRNWKVIGILKHDSKEPVSQLLVTEDLMEKFWSVKKC